MDTVQPKEVPEGWRVRGIDSRAADDRNGLTGAVNWRCSVPEWQQVVYGGEIVRDQSVAVSDGRRASTIKGEVGYGRGQLLRFLGVGPEKLVLSFFLKIVQRVQSRHNWGECGWNVGIADIGPVLLPLHGKPMNRRAERLSH